jgi:aldose 1-epimerase
MTTFISSSLGETRHGHALALLPGKSFSAAMLLLLLWGCGPSPQPASTSTQPAAATSAQPAATVDPTSMKQMNNEALSVQSKHFGKLPDGREVTLVTLRNSNGVELDVTNYGGIITRLLTPNTKGQLGDIVLGYDNLQQYLDNNPYFGAIIGRFGNRIAKGQFALEGKTYQLASNDGDNHLHGGVQGFDKKLWLMQPFQHADSVGVELSYLSVDGEEGYPGNLQVKVIYTLTNTNELQMQFQATTDQTTPVNLTQHSYFNLAGAGSILEHQLEIPAAQITPVGAGLIPTGQVQAVEGTPFDFRIAKAIGRDIAADDAQLKLGQGYDHNFVLKATVDKSLVLAGRVFEPNSGRVLEVWTEEPAVQFYSGNFLDGSLTGKGVKYGNRSGFCLEPQHYPDAPNQSTFPSTWLKPGETYSTQIVYRFSTQS